MYCTYISSCACSRYAHTYVGMVMWDGVEYSGCSNILTFCGLWLRTLLFADFLADYRSTTLAILAAYIGYLFGQDMQCPKHR